MILLLLTVPALAVAQSRISGKIIDKKGAPLPFANVLLLNPADSAMIKGEVADGDGGYAFRDVPNGNYLVLASMIGYRKAYTSIKAEPRIETKVPDVIVDEDSKMLNEVTVQAQKPLFEQHMDKLVVNIENSMTAAGGTVLEVLERSPGIIVNRQANSLSMAGKQGILVMINGKIQRLPMETIVQMLSGMNANAIEKIEIISNPSSKYDAQGDGGIINIVFKQNPDLGTNGSFSVTTGRGWRDKYSGTLNLNHRTKRYNIYGDYSVNLDKTLQYFNFRRRLEDEHSYTQSIRDGGRIVHRGAIGADFYLSPRTTVGVQVSAFDDKWEMDAVNNADQDIGGVPESNARLENHEINRWQNFMANVSLRRTTKNGTLSFDGDYLYYYDNNPSEYANQYHYFADDSRFNEAIRISKKTPINMLVLKTDYEFKVGKAKLETGAKAVVSRLHNDVGVDYLVNDEWSEDDQFSQNYDLKDDIFAAYVLMHADLSKTVKMQVGMRTESTDMEIESINGERVFDLSFWSLFPTAFLSKQLGKNTSLQFSYGRRITRPSYPDIAPFVIFVDQNTYFSGNPQLKPTMTNNIQTNFLYKGFLASVKYSVDTDFIANFQARVDPETRKTFLFSKNMDRVKTWNVNLSMPVSPAKWWTMNGNFNLTHQQINTLYDGVQVDVEQLYAQFNLSNSFTIGKGYSAELSGFYSSRSLFGLYTFNALGAVNIGLQKELSKNAGTVKLNFSDLFWTNKYIGSVRNNELSLDQGIEILFESRVFRVTYSKSFGNRSLKARQRSSASDDERSRVKN